MALRQKAAHGKATRHNTAQHMKNTTRHNKDKARQDNTTQHKIIWENPTVDHMRKYNKDKFHRRLLPLA
jgi:hypothetical protein